MKYKYLLSASIPLGILLSGCVCDTAVMQSTISDKLRSTTVDKLHVAPLPNYVKHNQGTEGPKRQNVAMKKANQSTPYICVHLVPTNSGEEIEYWITDSDGRSGPKHSKDSGNNESAGSDLFKTMFKPGSDIKLARAGNEVIIKGKAADGKRHAWKSASSEQPIAPTDSDILWNDQQ